jgi:hypothetical protein
LIEVNANASENERIESLIKRIDENNDSEILNDDNFSKIV